MLLVRRKATTEDFDALWQLHKATMRNYVDQTFGWHEDEQLAYFKNGFEPEYLTVLEDEGEIAGCFCLRDYSEYLFLSLIVIAPEYQSQGIGRQCLNDFIVLAIERAIPLELYVMKVNPSAKRLYESLGFQVIGELTKIGDKPTHDHMRWIPT